MQDTNTAPEIQQERLRLLLKNAAISSYLATAAGAASFLILGWYYYTPWLLAWVVGVTLISMVRAQLYPYFLGCSPGECVLEKWAAVHKWTGVVSGGLWGLLGAFPIDPLPHVLQTFNLLGPAIVATAALPSYGIRSDHYRAFLIALVTSLLASYTLANGQQALPGFLVFGIFGTLLNIIGQRHDKVFNASITARYEAGKAREDLEQANKHLAKQQELIAQEETIARHVFEQLTLSSDNDIPGVHAWNQAMGNLSGDLIQVAHGPEGEIYIFLGDFTGHGLPAALGAVPASTVFRTMVGKGFGVEVIAEELNAKLHSLLPTGYFCCAAIMQFSADRRHLTLWSGGLPPILIRRASDGALQQVHSEHLPLGVVGDAEFSSDCSDWTLADGDRVLVYSDGLTEAANANGEMWGRDRLVDFLMRYGTQGSSSLEKLKGEVMDFTDLSPASDDISVIEVVAGKADSRQAVA